MRSTVNLILAWLPLVGLWALFVLFLDGTPAMALVSGVREMGSAAILGFGVWWLCTWRPWPSRVGLGFYALHAAAGTAYAGAWLGINHAAILLRTGEHFIQGLRQTNVLGWRFLMGLWLYGLVAGVSYSLQTRRRLQEQERIAAQAQTLALDARLQSLTARLNPHFLFNALHSVSALIGYDPAAARRAVERLGELLRYNLDEDGEGVVPLAREWEFTRGYLELERLRLDERLTVETELDPDSMSRTVPCFTLQTLVENAIRHGISPIPKGGTIRISADIIDEGLRLSVADDGLGAAPDQLGEGHGLSSLRERLAFLYDGKSRLDVRTAPGSGFEAIVTLPPVQAGSEPGWAASPTDPGLTEALDAR